MDDFTQNLREQTYQSAAENAKRLSPENWATWLIKAFPQLLGHVPQQERVTIPWTDDKMLRAVQASHPDTLLNEEGKVVYLDQLKEDVQDYCAVCSVTPRLGETVYKADMCTQGHIVCSEDYDKKNTKCSLCFTTIQVDDIWQYTTEEIDFNIRPDDDKETTINQFQMADGKFVWFRTGDWLKRQAEVYIKDASPRSFISDLNADMGNLGIGA